MEGQPIFASLFQQRLRKLRLRQENRFLTKCVISYEVTCNHLHGPPCKWDYIIVLSTSRRYGELCYIKILACYIKIPACYIRFLLAIYDSGLLYKDSGLLYKDSG